MVSRLSLSLLASAMLVGACALHAQTASPSWATPVNDATGQQMMATPVTPGTPPLHHLPVAAHPADADAMPAPHNVQVAARPAYVRPTPASTAPLRPVRTLAQVERGTPIAMSHAVGSEAFVIPAGRLLSQGLSDYVKRFGWSMRWLISDDYRLDAPLPIPAGAMRAGVKYVFNAYQSQGGLLGSVPDFHSPNKYVVVEPVTAAKETQ